jgi:hypothetical protein
MLISLFPTWALITNSQFFVERSQSVDCLHFIALHWILIAFNDLQFEKLVITLILKNLLLESEYCIHG